MTFCHAQGAEAVAGAEAGRCMVPRLSHGTEVGTGYATLAGVPGGAEELLGMCFWEMLTLSQGAEVGAGYRGALGCDFLARGGIPGCDFLPAEVF